MSLLFVCAILHLAVLLQYRHVTHGQTDGWTDGHIWWRLIPALASVARVKLDNQSNNKLIKKREEAWPQYQTVCSTDNYAVYKRIRNKVTIAMWNYKEKIWLRLVRSFKPRFYGYARSKQSVKATVSCLLKEDGSTTKSDSESAELLYRQFQEVFTWEPDKPTLHNSIKPIPSIQFNAFAVMKKLKRLKPDKSSGPDEMDR